MPDLDYATIIQHARYRPPLVAWRDQDVGGGDGDGRLVDALEPELRGAICHGAGACIRR